MQAELPCSSAVLWVPMSTTNGTSCNIIGLFMLIVSATCHSCWQNGSPTIILSRDTDFCAEKGVSRHEKQPNDRKTVRDTRFHTEKGVSLQGNTAQRPKLSQPCSRYRFLCGKECVVARKAALCTEISPRHRVSPGVSQDYKRKEYEEILLPKEEQHAVIPEWLQEIPA